MDLALWRARPNWMGPVSPSSGPSRGRRRREEGEAGREAPGPAACGDGRAAPYPGATSFPPPPPPPLPRPPARHGCRARARLHAVLPERAPRGCLPACHPWPEGRARAWRSLGWRAAWVGLRARARLCGRISAGPAPRHGIETHPEGTPRRPRSRLEGKPPAVVAARPSSNLLYSMLCYPCAGICVTFRSLRICRRTRRRPAAQVSWHVLAGNLPATCTACGHAGGVL